MVDLREWVRTRAQRVKNPSKRKPDEETDSNTADIIERQLQQSGAGSSIAARTKATKTGKTLCTVSITSFAIFYNPITALTCWTVSTAMFSRIKHSKAPVLPPYASISDNGQKQLQSVNKTVFLHCNLNATISAFMWMKRRCSQSSRNLPPHEDIQRNGYVNLVILKMWGGIRAEYQTDNTEVDRCWMRIDYSFIPVWYDLFRRQGAWFTEYREPPTIGSP